MTQKHITIYLAGAVFLFSLLIYWMTTGTSLTTGDSGELAAAQYYWGIPHAPGYPYFTFLGYAWSNMLGSLNPLTALNLLTGVYAAIASALLFLVIQQIIEHYYKLPDEALYAIAVAGALGIAFSATFWSQAIGVEVYSLHTVILSVAILIGVKLIITQNQKYWVSLGVTMGFGFAHHLTIVLMGPAFLYLLIHQGKSKVLSAYQVAKGVGVGFIILVISWAMLMIRSASDPALDCGNPETLGNLFLHISGSPYQGYAFKSLDDALYNLGFVLHEIPLEFGIVGFFLAIVGIWSLTKKSQATIIYMLTLFITNIGIAINYSITDLNSYFLLAYIVLGILSSLGMVHVIQLFVDQDKWTKMSYSALLLPGFLLFHNFDANNFREYQDIELYYEEAVENLPKDAILFTMDFETDISSSYYYQLVENRRTDITIVDMISITNYDWFGNHLLKNDTTFFGACVDEYKKLCAINPEVYSDQLLAKKVGIDMFTCLFKKHVGSRPVYMSHWAYSDYFRPGGPIDVLNGYYLVPQQFFYEIKITKEYTPFVQVCPHDIISPKLDDRYTEEIDLVSQRRSYILRESKYISDFIRHRQARMLDHRIQYELKKDSTQKAVDLYEQLRFYFPVYQLPQEIVSELNKYVN